MMSSRFTRRAGLRNALLGMAALALAACGAAGPRVSDSGIAVDPNAAVRVALLVPQGSGDAGRDAIARSLVNAAELARSDLRNATIDIAVYPTGGTAEGGAAAANQAIAEGAKIIVGPLFSTATAGAAPIAASANVRVLSMSNNPEVAGGGVYLLGNTFNNTADQLVAYGLGRGLSNFGVVYPLGLEGETARNAVASSVQRRGASLVASEAYDVSVSGIEARAAPVAAALNARGANAVILTDGPTGGLGFMAEALRANGVSAATTQFLGLQRWDVSAEALSLASLQGGVFAAPDPGLVAAFEGRYQSTFGERPHELAGLAYDGIAAAGALIAQSRGSGGSPFSDARLTQSSGFAGTNGAFRFLPGGLNQRNLAILEVRGGSAVVTQRAARSFDAVGN
jgi:ABC-type branched-subunit amino acid transport system substrate-binding protein